MRNVVIASNAGAAWDELKRWDTSLQEQSTEAAEVRQSYTPKAPNTGVRVKVVGELDYASRIHAHASHVIIEYNRLLQRHPAEASCHADAISAWKLLLRTRDRAELESRLRVAIRLSGQRIKRVADITRGK